jgi:AcrR family transcriptional regulator
MTARAEKKERTRAAIVAAAHELFERDGFAVTTLPAIAAVAGVSPRTVSAAFRTKEAIVFERYPDAVARLGARLEEAPLLEALDAWVTTDLAPLRGTAVGGDPELWCIERRELLPAADLIAARLADTTKCALSTAHAAAAAAHAALLDADAGGRAAVLGFLRAGLAAL